GGQFAPEKRWSVCSGKQPKSNRFIGGQFAPESGGQFDRILHSNNDGLKEQRREAGIRILQKLYNAIPYTDSSLCSTYDYQEKILENNRLMLVTGYIYDKIKMDSMYLLKVVAYDPNCIVKISLTKNQFENTNYQTKVKESRYGGFIIRLEKLKQSDPVLRIRFSTDDNDEEVVSTYIEKDSLRGTYFLYGRLINSFICDPPL
ncbi:MAG: hypothetical protein ABSD71_14220, partial [Bacteroidales bacterium]